MNECLTIRLRQTKGRGLFAEWLRSGLVNSQKKKDTNMGKALMACAVLLSLQINGKKAGLIIFPFRWHITNPTKGQKALEDVVAVACGIFLSKNAPMGL